MSLDPDGELGVFLTATEASGLAHQLAAGRHLNTALGAVNPARRSDAQRLLTAAGLGHQQPDRSVAVLRAIAGAKSVRADLVPVWTMPGHQSTVGHLTGEFHRLVSAARQSVTCATYNFSPHSQMWQVLREASVRPGVAVTVYVDSAKGDPGKVKQQLPRAAVHRSATHPDAGTVVSHAKFVVIDHEMLLLTSANFSFNAENRNVEFGLLIRDSALAASVETTISRQHGHLYMLVD